MTALYDTVQKWQHKKIIQVFGATGGVRDKSRRTDLGKIAGKLADIAIITDEDPFDEDPQAIIHDIANAAAAEGKVKKKPSSATRTAVRQYEKLSPSHSQAT
jgi:UDP-N-acetylmuramoyl-L-alanyl-D-glutamate--2,6-diaminopimelate ligase